MENIFGHNCCEIPDTPVPNNTNDDGKFLFKKHPHPRTDVGDDEELPRKKKVKKNCLETEVDSSSLDNSCFVAIVTALNLLTDTLYLPQHFTTSNGLTRKCRKIVLIDGGERSWALDLRFNESSDTFYISRGWRSFCDENGKKSGGFFMFKLVGNGETPVLSFCPKESIDNRRQRDCSEASGRESISPELSSEKENIEGESSKEECSSMESFVHRLSLPKPFLRENGINKPGKIYLLGKDGTKLLTNLLLDKKGTMSLGKGWKDFVKENSLETGFTLKLIWEDTTPVLSLCCEKCISDRGQEEFSKTIEKQSLFIDPSNKDKISKDENNKEERRSWENHLIGRDSTPSSQKQLVTLTITPDSVRKCRLHLPAQFLRENSMNKPGMIYLLGKDGRKWMANLVRERDGRMFLRNGWKDFVKENGLKMGDSFMLKLIWEDTTSVLSLCPAECSIDRGAGGGCSETNQKKSLPIEPSSCKKISKDESIKDDNSKDKNNKAENSKEENNKEENKSMEREKTHLKGRDSTPLRQKQFVTLKITPSSFTKCRLILPMQFARENSMNKPGMIYLVGKDGTKWLTNLQRDKKGTMSLGKSWKDFGEANDLKLGESFKLELTWEDAIPMLSLFRTESSSSKANEKESISTEPKSRDSSSTIQNRFTTLALTPEDVRACKLHLPSQFMKANGINKLRKITLLGENGMEWSAYLLSRDGIVALGNGWDEFCEANGVKLGEFFTLEFINEQDKTTPVLKFCSLETNKYKNVN